MADQSRTVIVVGGGAAGMMAALAAADHGARVTVLDHMDKVGKKILVAGNGRCNITNTRQDVSHYHGAPPSFIEGVLRSFPVDKTRAFFKSLGLVCVEEEEGRVYPSCGQASAVRSALQFEMDRRHVHVHCGVEVRRLVRENRGFKIETKGGHVFSGDRVIVAAGGMAAPDMGTNGSGFDLVKPLGHHVTPLFPALVQLNLQAPFLKEVDGVRFTGAVAVVSEGRVLREAHGEIQLTNYGASGIPVMDLSRTAGECLLAKRDVSLELRLLSERTPQDIWEDVRQRISSRPDETLERAFLGLVHSKLVPVLIQTAGFKNKHVSCRLSSSDQAKTLSELLTRWRLPITGTQSWSRAQVTAGGVVASEIYGETMESTIVPGLFLAGEIIDVDGDTGGYNLQWAWSSGRMAGLRAAS